MGTAFGLLVKQRLADLGMSQRDFAAHIGLSHGTVNKIINASHEAPPPPLGSDLEKWAAILQIAASDHQRFCALAALVYLPPSVRPQWEIWYDHYCQLTDKNSHTIDGPLPRVAENTPPYDRHS